MSESDVFPPQLPPENQILIEEEMKSSYLDYAMSVIVSRALPDVRDGLKPVHRRILYAMKEGGYTNDKPFRKSARIVGDVMGKYHPHGDSAIYDSLVRMAQDFSLRLPLVDKQGNFGSMGDDPPAAMRYTEAKLAKSAQQALLDDIDKDTVDFVANYDGSLKEPSVLPAQYPNLLVNGAGGIAVGMATNIPPHNLGEVVEGTLALIDNPDLTATELVEYVPGPDFPTGGLILGKAGAYSAYTTGKGSVVMRAKTHFEEFAKGRQAIVITEIPYQVNLDKLIEKIAQVYHEKKVEGITQVRDETNRQGVRIVIELKKDVEAEVVLNQLFKFTPLQTSFGCNMLAIHEGRPVQMDLREILRAFVDFREQVIYRRTAYELGKARERAHILCGLAVAVANIDDVIALIRHAPDPEAAKQGLMAKDWATSDIGILLQQAEGLEEIPATYKLTETQAKAILDLRLHRLTGLEREKIAGELSELVEKIKELLAILGDRDVLFDVMRAELNGVKEKFATPRRTEMVEGDFDQDIEDLIQREDMVVTITHNGYIKRVPLSTYRAQKRGGKGRSGMSTREEDFVNRIFVANTHTPILFFTNKGMVHSLKVYKLPVGSPSSLGKPMINMLPLDKDEFIATSMPMPEDESLWADLYVMFATSAGSVRRNQLSDFTNIRANGKIAMKLEEDGEKLVAVAPCHEGQDVFLSARSGKCIRFSVTEIRVFQSRASTGVRGMKLGKGDHIVSMNMLESVEMDTETRESYFREELPADQQQALKAKEQFMLVVSANGYAKRSSAYEYRTAGRGGMGIANMDVTSKTGEVVASFPVEETDQVMLVSNAGTLIRCPIHNVRIAGRATQGVILFKTDDGEEVVSVAHLPEESGEDDTDPTENLSEPTAEVEVEAATKVEESVPPPTEE